MRTFAAQLKKENCSCHLWMLGIFKYQKLAANFWYDQKMALLLVKKKIPHILEGVGM